MDTGRGGDTGWRTFFTNTDTNTKAHACVPPPTLQTQLHTIHAAVKDSHTTALHTERPSQTCGPGLFAHSRRGHQLHVAPGAIQQGLHTDPTNVSQAAHGTLPHRTLHSARYAHCTLKTLCTRLPHHRRTSSFWFTRISIRTATPSTPHTTRHAAVALSNASRHVSPSDSSRMNRKDCSQHTA